MADRIPGRFQLPRSNFSGARQQAAEAPESDPLAELARLIGQTAPQANLGRSQTAAVHPNPDQGRDESPARGPSWLQTAQANLQTEHAGGQHYEAQAYHQADAEPVLTPMPSFLRNPQPEHAAPRHDASRYDNVLFGQQHQDQYADQYPDDQRYEDEYAADEQYDESSAYQEPKRARAGGMLTVAVVLGLAVVGTASAYAYRSYVGSPRSGTPPVFRADTSPTKVVPPVADGASKMFNDRVASSDGPERVVSREEQPVDVNAQRSVFPTPGQSGPTVASSGSAAGAGGAAWDEPRRIRTVPIRTEQPTSAPQSAAPPARAVATQPVTVPRGTPQTPAPVATASAGANGPMPLTPNNVRSASASAPPAAAAPAVQTASVSPLRGGFVVQIASQKTEAEAQASYKSAQTKYPNVLGSRSPLIKRADLGDKGVYYRAMVGPFASQEEAGQLCSNLRVAGGQCVVQRN